MAKPKAKSVFKCDSCGNQSPKWEGRCSSCNNWNTLSEIPIGIRNTNRGFWEIPTTLPAKELSALKDVTIPRFTLFLSEVNRVLGGGIVPGSVVLIGGEPGIGKSTLLLQIASDISNVSGHTLYVTGEESVEQVKLRADRLGVVGNGLFLLQTTSLTDVMSDLNNIDPVFVIIDSIQTLHDDSIDSTSGSISQIRECTRALLNWAKSRGIPVMISGHVTKEGEIAGPRMLEHMVDVVLYMEGDTASPLRLLRAAKNRFGSLNEIGVFEMLDRGLVEILDPSSLFLSEHKEGMAGSVVISTLEGSRPLLLEVQALTNRSTIPVPRRVATGVDNTRLLLICAILTRRAGILLHNHDVVVNIPGGLKISEPAADLGIALSIVSSLHNSPITSNLAVIGELGLTGEVRGVTQIERRVAEVSRLGFKQCLVPKNRDWHSKSQSDTIPTTPVNTITEAIRASIPGVSTKMNDNSRVG